MSADVSCGKAGTSHCWMLSQSAARCRGTWYDITTWAARTHNCDNHPESVACMACSQVSRHLGRITIHHADLLYIAGMPTSRWLCFPLQNMPPFTKQTGVVPIGASAATCCNMHMIALLRSWNSPWRRDVSTARPPHPKLTSRMLSRQLSVQSCLHIPRRVQHAACVSGIVLVLLP